jgi:hypothetical protein
MPTAKCGQRSAEVSQENFAEISKKLTTGENRKIDLYGRYKWTCGSHAEAVAFIKGVEAVLSHLID